MVQHLVRNLQVSFQGVRAKSDAVILSEAGVLSARRIRVRWGGGAKNLSSFFAPKKEKFFVAREKQGARILRVKLKRHALLRMTPFARMQEEECIA